MCVKQKHVFFFILNKILPINNSNGFILFPLCLLVFFKREGERESEKNRGIR